MKCTITILLVLASSSLLSAQDFIIKRVELQGGTVNVYYDLTDTVKYRSYTIDLYTSLDNYVTRLDKVTGDVGLEVKPGGNRKISWSAKEELGNEFAGKVSLEVRGRIYIPFVRLEGLGTKYKRKTDYSITWTGGTQQNVLNFDLYNGDEKVFPFSNIANVGQTVINIPTAVKPGKDYYFKVTDSKNKDQIVNSSRFTVKRKIPLVLVAVPILIIGSAIALIPKPPPTSTIPEPLSPTSIH